MVRSWREVIPIHPAADLFPMMSEPELRKLGEDIKRNGLTSPIVFLDAAHNLDVEHLLDGRNRLDAMELVGINLISEDTSRFPLNVRKTLVPTGTDPVSFVISANIHRRHLDADQKRELIAQLLKASPEKSNRQIGEAVKADGKTVGVVRSKMEASAEIPQLLKTVGGDGKARPARLAAKRKQPARPAVDAINDHALVTVSWKTDADDLAIATAVLKAIRKRPRGKRLERALVLLVEELTSAERRSKDSDGIPAFLKGGAS